MRALGLALLTLCMACGDSIAGEGYRGEPLFRVGGRVVTLIMMSPLERPRFRASAFWIKTSTTAEPSRLVEQSSVSTEILLSGDFELIFFEPPPESAFLEDRPGLAAGLVLVYRDADLDGRYSAAADELLGGTLRHGFFYATSEVPAAEAPAGVTIPTGFSSSVRPLVCEPAVALDPAPLEVELVISGSVSPEELTCL